MSNLNDDELMKAAMGDLDGNPSASEPVSPPPSQTPILPNQKLSRCDVCNRTIDTAANFCPNCGAKIGAEHAYNDENSENVFKGTTYKVNNNKFAKYVKNDVNNSQLINIIKDKVKTNDSKQKKKLGIIAIATLIVIVLIVVIANVHTCDECEKTFIGKKYEVTWFGKTKTICEECNREEYPW